MAVSLWLGAVALRVRGDAGSVSVSRSTSEGAACARAPPKSRQARFSHLEWEHCCVYVLEVSHETRSTARSLVRIWSVV